MFSTLRHGAPRGRIRLALDAPGPPLGSGARGRLLLGPA